MAQLGNKVQHALHAYTPSEQRGAKAAADSFRVNPEFKTAEKLEELGIGEALVSVLDEAGVPTVVEITKIDLPHSSMKPINMNERDEVVYSSPLFDKYSEAVDRYSAYEELNGKSGEGSRYGKSATTETEELPETEEEDDDPRKAYARAHKISSSTGAKQGKSTSRSTKSSGRRQKSASEKIVRSVANTAAGTIGREVGNSFGKSVGGSFGRRLGGNVGATLARGIMGTFLK